DSRSAKVLSNSPVPSIPGNRTIAVFSGVPISALVPRPECLWPAPADLRAALRSVRPEMWRASCGLDIPFSPLSSGGASAVGHDPILQPLVEPDTVLSDAPLSSIRSGASRTKVVFQSQRGSFQVPDSLRCSYPTSWQFGLLVLPRSAPRR